MGSPGASFVIPDSMQSFSARKEMLTAERSEKKGPIPGALLISNISIAK